MKLNLRASSIAVAVSYTVAAFIVTLIVCGLWEYSQHSLLHNLLCVGGLLIALLINVSVSYSLVYGVRHNMPNLMLPYIFCASFHLIFSMMAILYFLLSALDDLWTEEFNQLQSIGFLIFFVFACLAWLSSIIIVRQQRETAQKDSGEYCAFDDY
uniref:MARVEL domain-containing protein n=1 Tax=Syphacia muris TaxID=451379 RepID=A0A0N5ARA8_9BILA